MAEADPSKAILAKDGHLVLPKAIRDELHWGEGTQFTFERTADGVLLKGEPLFPRTTVAEVAGMLKHLYDGPPKTIEEMDEGVMEEVRRRHALGRY